MIDWTAVGTALGGIAVGAGGVISLVVRAKVKSDERSVPTPTTRSNGHPCALHEGLVASIGDIQKSAESHHVEQQSGIDRIHARIDDLYRDLVRRP